MASICEAFLEWSQKNQSPRTYKFYLDFLNQFCRFHRGLKVADLKPFHITRWLDSHARPEEDGVRRADGKVLLLRNGYWGDTTRFHAIRTVQRAFAWASGDEGYLAHNPIARYRKPRQSAGRR